MNRVWRVALYEYQRNVFKKSFLLTLLSIPLMVAFSVGVGFFMVSLENNDLPVGYLDQAGVFENPIPAPVSGGDEPVDFISYQTEEEALASLEAKEIQAFYILPTDYFETRRIEIVYTKKPADNANRQWWDFLQINLLSDQPTEIAYRSAAGAEVTVRSLDGKRVIADSGPAFGNFMPIFITMAFLALILMSSGFLMGAVAEEKENRTMEIMVTSISPLQMIGGKLLGIVGIGLTLLVSWTLIVILGIYAARLMGIAWFQNLGMNWSVVLASIAIAAPAYVLVSALMITIGTMVTSTQEGQSFSSVFIILHLVPLYLGFAFVNEPDSSLAATLTILPFTSLMATAMRNLVYSVPIWQVVVSVCVQTLSAAGAIWLASRAFRLGMLRYGQRLSWRNLLQLQQTGE
jgi:ABC-2 type transport system permease protein